MLDATDPQAPAKVEHCSRLQTSSFARPRLTTAKEGGKPVPFVDPDPADYIDPPPPEPVSVAEAARRDAQEDAIQWLSELIEPNLPAPQTTRERQAYAKAQVYHVVAAAFRLSGVRHGLCLADYARALGVSASRLSEPNQQVAKLIPDSTHL